MPYNNQSKVYAKGPILLLLTLVILTAILIRFSLEKVRDGDIRYEKYVAELREQGKVEENMQAYYDLVKFGMEKLRQNDLKGARIDLQAALKLYPSGKKANYAFTQALIQECIQHQKNCKLAEDFMLQLKATAEYTAQEIANLEQSIYH